MTASVELDCTQLADALCGLFGRFAVKSDKVRARRNNVGCRIYKNDDGRHMLNLSFMSKENFLVDFEVDVLEAFENHQHYIGHVLNDVMEVMQDAKQRRFELTSPLVGINTGALN